MQMSQIQKQQQQVHTYLYKPLWLKNNNNFKTHTIVHLLVLTTRTSKTKPAPIVYFVHNIPLFYAK